MFFQIFLVILTSNSANLSDLKLMRTFGSSSKIEFRSVLSNFESAFKNEPLNLISNHFFNSNDFRGETDFLNQLPEQDGESESSEGDFQDIGSDQDDYLGFLSFYISIPDKKSIPLNWDLAFLGTGFPSGLFLPPKI